MVSNPERGEVGFTYEDKDGEKKTLTFKVNNAGRRAMEDFLDLEYPEIDEKIGTGRLGNRVWTALLFGATRKFHARRFPDVDSCDEFMDWIYDADEDMRTDMQVALLAANARATVKEMRRRIGLDRDPDEDEESPEADPGKPANEEETPEDEVAAPKKAGKAQAASGRGKSSSGKESTAA